MSDALLDRMKALEHENIELKHRLERIRDALENGALFGVYRAYKNNDEPLYSTVCEKVKEHLNVAFNDDAMMTCAACGHGYGAHQVVDGKGGDCCDCPGYLWR